MFRDLGRSLLLSLLVIAVGAAGLTIQATVALAAPTTCGGVVFHDYDHDGERTEDYSHVAAEYAGYDDEGVAGINVLITTVSGTTVSATTGANGAWTANLDTNDFPIRVDFSGLPAGWTPTPKGADSDGLTQHIANSAACGVGAVASTGISAPASFCETQPELATTCFLFGNVDDHDNQAAVVTLIDGAVDNGSTSGSGWQTDPYTPIATMGQVGSVYGIDYNPHDESTFVGSFVKRHTQLGSTGNPTTIYRIDAGGAVAPWFTTDTAAADPHSGATDGWLADFDAFEDVGRSGLGDIEISPDGSTLYAVDLGQRQLVAIPINSDGTANAAGVVRTTLTSASLGLATCPDSDIRPFGLGFDGNQLLVGATCSAESTVPANAAPLDENNVVPLGDPTQLAAYVYSFTPGSGFSLVTNVPIPLFDRGTQNGRVPPDPLASRAGADWRPWLTEPPYAVDMTTWPEGGVTYPQPLLSDIEVDGDDLVIGFIDLWGHQMGSNATYERDGVVYDLYQPLSTGDIMRAESDGAGGFTFPLTGVDYTYTADSYPTTHSETALGSAAQIPGRPYVIANSFDPINGGSTWQSGGLEWMANESSATIGAGEHVRGYRLYDGRAGLAVGTFEKAAGIGDVEARCGLAPIQVGDYVWFDANSDGIADPGEQALDGVVIELLDSNGNVVATATTDADGLYLFDIPASEIGNSFTIQVAQSNYDPGGVFAAGGAHDGKGFITQTDVGSDDANDNDGALVGGLPTITFTASETDHTMDFGFVDDVYDLALTKVYTSDTFGNTTDGIIENGADVTFTITVTNQGTVEATTFDVTDYIPSGFTLNDAGWTDNGDGTATTAGGPLLAGNSADFLITLTATGAPDGTSVNWAEISAADGTDIDSTPDTTQGNDTQPTGPGEPTDNVTDNTSGDEDDHDPAGVTVATYDLALQKVYTSDTFGATTDGVIEIGADVTFTITVTNQGTLDAATFDVTDYLPSGFVLSAVAADNAAWTDNGDGTATTTGGPLAAGAAQDFTITLTAASTGAGELANWAEISADDGNDVDSTTDANQVNDNQPGAPGDPTDGVIDNTSGDEDDHDVAGVTVEAYDLALTKVYTSDTFGAPADGVIDDGADVTFTITVTNQGTLDAATFDVTDYLPSGFVLSAVAADSAAWTDNGDGTATTTGGPLAAGAAQDFTITLTANGAAQGDYVNWAEISADDGNDVDSTPDANSADDAQPTGPGAPTDDVIDNTAGDSDDHDPAGVSVGTYDLALIKVYTSDTFGAPADGVIDDGADVTFTITVTNQGTLDATKFDVTDYLPAGFVLNDAAWTDNGDGTASTSGGPLAAGASTDITITLTASGAALGDAVNWAEISADDGNDVDSTPDTDPADDAQPGGPGDPTDNVVDNTAGDSDDHDPAGVTVANYDLALTKVYTSDTSGAPTDGVVEPGDDVTFTITVFNQGTVDATTFDVTDYYPPGFVLSAAAADSAAWTDNGDGTATTTAGPIVAGRSIQLTITLTANGAPDGDHVNWAEISADDGNDTDSTPDTDPADDAQPGGPGDPTDNVVDNTAGDSDDHDPAGITVASYDLALTKVYASDTFGDATDGIIEEGTDVTFTITVTNQGALDAASFEVTDYLPAGFVLNDAAWTDNGDGTATIAGGPLAAGASTTFDITLTADSVAPGEFVNWAEISEDDGNDVDSTPDAAQGNDDQPAAPGAAGDDVIDNSGGDEDDHDLAGVSVANYDLALTKVYTSDTHEAPGDGIIEQGTDVTFTITVINQGTIDSAGVTVTDFLPAGFVLNDAAWTDNGDGTASINTAAIPAGGQIPITITLTAANTVAGTFVNGAEISTDDGNDIDSTPNADPADDNQPAAPGDPTDNEINNTSGDEDDHDIAGVSVEIFDLALQKVYTSDTFGSPTDAVIDTGANVTFTITVINQGTVDATTFEVTDYIPAGFTLNDAAWTDNGDGTAAIAGGPLAAGDSADFEITMTAGVVAPGGYVNGAEISVDDGNDADSTPDADVTNDAQPSSPGDPTDDVIDNTAGDEDDHDIAGVGVENFDLALIKVLSDDGFGDPADGLTENGADVTFTVTVINQGTIDAGSFDVTDYIPAGFVLNDPAWTDNGDGTATTTGGPLAAGASTDITIVLTADAAATGVSVNIAEISSDDGTDIDSTPDSDPADDGQPAAPGDPTDDISNNANGDSDDHDIAGVTIGEFDLALTKVYTSDTSADGNATDGQVQVGDDATFTITVINQGTLDADTFDVTDYFPPGFVLSAVAADSAAWTDNGDSTATITGGPLAAGASQDFTITLTVTDATPGQLVNGAEISSDTATDIDSMPDSDPADDNQPAAPGDPTDDVTDNTSGDEDDHDIAGLIVDVYDLALVKDFTSDTSADGNSTDGVIQAGDDATFTITVTNQGTVDASTIDITDYLPLGFVLNDPTWTDNGNNTATTSVAGPLAPGASTSVTITLTAATPGAGQLVNWAEISSDDGDDIDSTPNTSPNDDGTPPSEDDIDDAPLTVDAYDLALTKVYTSDTSTDGVSTDGVIAAGDDITFTITVYNQGTVDAANIEVTDFMPAGLSLNDAAWTDNGDGTAATTIAAIPAGGSVDVMITLTADNPATGAQLNAAEISNDDGSDIDSTPNADVNDDGPITDGEINNAAGDEDDHDPAPFMVVEEIIPVFDLALRKTLQNGSNSASVGLGDTVTWTITVFNQGEVNAANIDVIDYIPSGLDLADSDWTENADGNAVINIAGPIAPGASVSVDITTTVVNGTDLTNLAEIASADPVDAAGVVLVLADGTVVPDADSVADDSNSETPIDDVVDNTNGDEDDHDIATVVLVSTETPLAVTGTTWTIVFLSWALGLFFLGAALVLFARKEEDELAYVKRRISRRRTGQ